MTNTTPTVAPAVRTIAYWATFVVSTIVLLGTGLSPIWWPDLADNIAQTATVVSAAVSFIAGGLGVVYRPTGTTTIGDTTVAIPDTAADVSIVGADEAEQPATTVQAAV